MNAARPAYDFLNKIVWAALGIVIIILLLTTGFITARNFSAGALHPSPFSHSMPEEDFANLWSAGHLARAGAFSTLYSSDLFTQWKQTQFGAPLQTEDWIYPPSVLLLGAPLSFLPLPIAFVAWDLATLALAVLVLRAARLPWLVLLAGLAGPASWRSLVLGNYGVLTGALVLAGLLLAPRAPLRAGLLLGLATLKPQQGVLVPVAWAAARNWRAIAAGGITFASLAFGAGLAFGWPAWTMFFTRAGAMARHLVQAPPPQNYISDGVSVFWMCRTAGAGIAVAYAAQLAAALAAAGITCRVWRLHAPALPRAALTASLSLLITPYGFTSDMVAFSLALAIITAGNGWRLSPLNAAIWLWPAYCPLVTLKTGLLLTPALVVIVSLQAWRQLVAESHLASRRCNGEMELSDE